MQSSQRFQDLVAHGQHPKTLFIGCSATAAIEFAVLNLQVEHIIVCGHSHCGAVRAAYEGAPAEAINLRNWLHLLDEALLPVQVSPEALDRTGQRSVVLQVERLLDYPMVRRAVEAGRLHSRLVPYLLTGAEPGDLFIVRNVGALVPPYDGSHGLHGTAGIT